MRKLSDMITPYLNDITAAFALWWMAAFCLLMLPTFALWGMNDFAFPLLFLTFLGIVQGIYYFGRARHWWGIDFAPEEESEREADDYPAPTPIRRTPATTHDPEYLDDLRQFYRLTMFACRGLTSENAVVPQMQKLHKAFGRGRFNDWMPELEAAGVVQNNGQGKPRTVLIPDSTEALAAVAEKVFHDPDVWEPIILKTERLTAHKLRVTDSPPLSAVR